MPISKIKGGAINDDAISTAKIVDDAVTSPKIVDSYTTALQTNPEFSGTEGARMPNGTTAQRANAQSGDIRFNSTLSLMEYYDGVRWKSIDSPPTISSLSPSTFDASGDTITVNGSNFQTGANVTLIAADGGTYTPASVTRVSDTQITFDITSSIVADPDDPFDIKIENASGLSITSADALTVQGTLTATTSAGSLGTVYDAGRTSLSYNLSVADSSSETDVTFAYAVTSGSVPAGLSLNTSTGALTGTANAAGSDTTSNFTVTATGTDSSDSSYSETLATAYSLTVAAPVITSYTSTGSGTFSVPTGLTTVDVLVVAGGGAGGKFSSTGYGAGGGGAGGLVYRPAFPVTPAGSISYTVGAGGNNSYGHNQANPQNKGQDSVFGTLTSKGGGCGASTGTDGTSTALNGGSGGGHCYGSGGPSSIPDNSNAAIGLFGNPSGRKGGDSTQPQVGGDSTTYGFGNSGGDGETTTGHGSGGGGAGTAGYDYGLNNAPQGGGNGHGGAGKAYSITGASTLYAGGGGGGAYFNYGLGAAGGGNGGTNGGQGSQGTTGATSAQANRGSGGGGAASPPGPSSSGDGGSGVIVVKY